jgi:hypothetical protein
LAVIIENPESNIVVRWMLRYLYNHYCFKHLLESRGHLPEVSLPTSSFRVVHIASVPMQASSRRRSKI